LNNNNKIYEYNTYIDMDYNCLILCYEFCLNIVLDNDPVKFSVRLHGLKYK
jgi:hypothetical protein